MTTIYMDLDGTILNVWKRLYAVYFDTTRELGGTPVSALEYRKRKRTGIAEEEIVGSSLVPNTQRYSILRMERLETLAYLRHDKLLPVALSSLSVLGWSNRVVLTTARRNRNSLHRQLLHMGIADLLDGVLPKLHDEDPKCDMISRDRSFDPTSSVIVGDTEGDVRSGKRLGIRTIAVLSGIRGRDALASHNPDLIVEDISQLPSNFLVSWCGV